MQPASARGRVPQGRGSAENAADQPDAGLPLPALRDVSVALVPRRVTLRSPVSQSSHRSPACIAAIQFPRTSARGRVPPGRGSAENAADPPREQKRTQRDRREQKGTQIFSETADCELQLPRNPQPRPAVLRAVVQSPSADFRFSRLSG